MTLYFLYIPLTVCSDILEDPTVTRTLHAWTLCPSAASKVQHSTTPGCINDCRCCWKVTGRKAAFTREGVVVISSFTQLLLCWMGFCRRLTGRLAAATSFYICLSTAQLVPFILCTRTKKEENRQKKKQSGSCTGTKQHWLSSTLPSSSSSEQVLSGVAPSLFKKHLLCSI